MSRVAIIGSASWGTALGIALARKGTHVKLWTRTGEEANKLNKEKENTTFLPDFHFPFRLWATSSVEEAIEGAAAVILAVPAQSVRQNIQLIGNYLADSVPIVSASKGLELDTNKRMSQVIAEEIAPHLQPNICVLSGPSIAQEAAMESHSAVVIAANNIAVAEKVQQVMSQSCFCTFTTTDVIGVELGGALKNVIALGVGIAEGLGYGDNAKAAFITYGLAEITSLGVAMGANPLTFTGLACLGDIIVTCFSPSSRNRDVGIKLAKGHALEDILSSLPHIPEGIATTIAARQLARRMGANMPATERIYRVLYEGLDPKIAATELIEYYADKSYHMSESKLVPHLASGG
jgi:glycerol-3-phosphate dehydrogenase (NAD(P)+)